MLWYTFVFLVLAVVAALLGFTGIAILSADLAKILFIVFLILFLISLIFGGRRHHPPPM